MKIYNTLTNKQEIIETIKKKHIKMYVCGVTPYDDCHVGHARIFIVYDTLVRYFKYKNYKITYVQNITDVDDKIIKKAKEKKITIKNLVNTNINKMENNNKILNIIKPNYKPRVTKFIKEIILYIINLYKKKYAYIGINGDVYYNVKKNKKYGLLSNRKTFYLKNNTRVLENNNKIDQKDFVLWKNTHKDLYWNSPFGYGRPGWHIECSVMSEYYLGKSFDLHGGGIDLLFPHHENEYAQALISKKNIFAKYWMHVGLVVVENKKMSKKIQNFTTIKSILETTSSETLRYFLLTKHYRKPINFCKQSIKMCENSLKTLYKPLENYLQKETSKKIIIKKNTIYEKKFISALENDLNTPKALAVLFQLVNKIKKTENNNKIKLCKLLKFLGNILGLLTKKPDKIQNKVEETTATITQLIEQRNLERKKGNWSKADELKIELIKKGVIIKDNKI